MNREEILECVLIAFEEYYELFLQTGALQQLVKQYNEWLVSLNTEVRVLDPQGEYSGISRGINENGELLVEVPDGKIEVVYAGEVFLYQATSMLLVIYRCAFIVLACVKLVAYLPACTLHA